MITVSTPTYNRAYILPSLYQSLLRQTSKDFEWLIVDDGSTDNSRILIENWIKEDLIRIRYLYQNNGGKHRAINYGAKEACGELFFIVDSDDSLSENAIERIEYYYKDIKYNPLFAGVCGLRCFPNGNRIGGECDFKVLDCNSLDFRYKYNVKGDMAEVLRTDVIRQYPFPEFEGEKFCPEALVFNRIAQRYMFRYFYEKIYICDYLPDGLTAKITKIRMNSPKSSALCYAELTRNRIPFSHRVKAAINYWRFSFCERNNLGAKIKGINWYWMFVMPIGYAMYKRDLKIVKI